jgi:hypothetical protein
MFFLPSFIYFLVDALQLHSKLNSAAASAICSPPFSSVHNVKVFEMETLASVQKQIVKPRVTIKVPLQEFAVGQLKCLT